MNKLIPLIMISMVMLIFAGCGNDPLTSGGSATAATAATSTDEQGNTQATEAEKISQENYSKNLKGLAEYFNDLGYIENDEGNTTEMQYKLIGAKAGNRYVKGTASVELYEFDTKNLNDTAKAVIESVKNEGKFTLYDKETEAYLSDNEKYLMIYTDSAADDKASDAYKTKQAAIKDFKELE